jgi:hypothetical protein
MAEHAFGYKADESRKQLIFLFCLERAKRSGENLKFIFYKALNASYS